MTAVVAPFPSARARRVETAGRGSLAAIVAFAAAVFMLLIYSQGWELLVIGGDDETAHAELLRNLFLPAYGASVLLAAFAPASFARGLVRQPFLIALLCVVTASWFWSASPDQTSRRLFALIFTTLSGAALAARFSWARLAEAISACFAILALASLFAGLFAPSFGRMTDLFPGAWRGLWLEKNSFGGFMAVGAAACAGAALLNPRRGVGWWGAALLCIFLVIMSTSKTALISLVAAAGALVLVWAVRRGRASAVAMIWAAGVALAIAGVIALFAPDLVFKALGKSETLTGRTDI
ncbi:MAG TPA: O-antigen ligase family protein, partial [Caulobacteraceae bacterium]